MPLFSRETLSDFQTALPPFGRLIGLDVGTRTIGIAVSDATRLIATPHTTLERRKFSTDATTLLALYKEVQAAGWVIGLPLSMDGRDSDQTRRCRQFALELDRRQPSPVLLWDERLSTAAMERLMTEEADLSRRRRGQLIDKMAAGYFLQGCLDALRG